ncbi:hypothetical protein NA57DRAFT_60540 [Rhizodiscina lignyota]|uniref:MARVEL domain-containing protein n=1 Tax=Rhizodiscina lignyota TaxID=1504668 RepID=A0A9P4I607_9PEZI|nr:hypothetical protein NA57DRAFT_60540 [Rhizodiscina lignyota]
MRYIRDERLRDVLNIAILVFLLLAVVLSIVVIGITAAAANGFKNDLGCDSPGKLDYNIAAGVITFIILPTLLLLHHCFRGSRNRLGYLTPNIWLMIYAIFVVLWAAALGSAFCSCSDLCSVCGTIVPSFVVYAGKCCNCASANGEFVDFCAARGDRPIVGFERRHHWYEATQGLDVVIMILFILSGASAISLHIVRRDLMVQRNDISVNENMPVPNAALDRHDVPGRDQAPPP